MAFGVGHITSFDPLTGQGVISTPDGAPAAFRQDAAVRTGITEADIGSPVTFRAQNGLHFLIVIGLSVRRTSSVSNPPSPDYGEIVRLICTVSFCAASNPHRFIWHPDIPGEILVQYKGRIRRDLRTGDKVIAEIIRTSKSLLAIRAVRLPADYLSRTEKHAGLLTCPSPTLDASPLVIR